MNDGLPKHIAIVMDGNGRWAVDKGLERIEGHVAGVKAVKKIIQCCVEQGIEQLSLFAFSSENWNRPVSEVEFLMSLFLQSLQDELVQLNQNGIKLRFIGDRSKLSQELLKQMDYAQNKTLDNQRLHLNIVVNYGGRWDIVQAAKQIAGAVAASKMDVDDIDEQLFAGYLSTEGVADPDLLIRTSGEQRISNFFLWQLAYTELYFTQQYWPDFDEQSFSQALAHFACRERRYGKTSQQLQGGAHA